jgi:hypothetical protein
MIPVAGGSCRTVAPLIARYNDPDLGEAERVLLSTHLLQCPCCLAQLQAYRALDQRLRHMSGITLSPQVRESVLERVAAPSPNFAMLGFPSYGRQIWISAATAFSLTALVIVFSLSTFRSPQQTDGAIVTSQSTNDTVARPLTTTILAANPTQVASGVGGSLPGTMVVSGLRVGASFSVLAPVPLLATVREVNARDGGIVVLLDGGQQEERFVVTRDTIILWSDGQRGSLADIAAGAVIQVQRDQPTAGGTVAQQIILSR